MTNAIIVAATLIMEAGGEGTKGLQAVREVIHTRATERRMTEAEVCLQRKQFSCWNGKDWPKLIEKAKAHPRWKEAVKLAGSPPLTSLTRGANHYHTLKVSPYWSKGKTPVATIGHHKFYRL